MGLSDDLKAFIDNPEQLDQLPAILAAAQALEQQHTAATDRINGLTESNAKLLKLIPVADTSKKPDEPAKKVTLQDAVNNLFEKMEKKEV